jgi:hypothetical protein
MPATGFTITDNALNTKFNITSAGAATFSSSLTVNGFINLGSSAVFPTVGLLNRTSDTTLYLKAAASGFSLLDNSQNGMYQATPTSHIWSISNSEKMRINSVGNVGIGTTTPDQILSVRKTSAGAETIALSLQNISQNPGTAVSMVFCPHENSSTPEPLAKISAIRTATSFAPTDLAFYTYGTGGLTEKMRMITTGELCVGTNTPSYNTTNRGNITINGAASSLLAFQVAGFAKAYAYHDGTHYSIVNNATGNIYVSSNGGGVQLNSGATSWTSSSDERLKNINSNIENAVDKLSSLRTVIFSWKSDETQKEVFGLIAQDVDKVFPQVVDKGKLPVDINEESTDETEYLNLRYTELIPVLVKAIQELSAENTSLINRIEALENK